MLGRMLDSTRARRKGDPAVAAQKRAKRQSERVLLLFDRGAFRGGGSRRVVSIAVAVPDFIYGRLRCRAVRFGNLVFHHCGKTTLNRRVALLAKFIGRLCVSVLLLHVQRLHKQQIRVSGLHRKTVR